MTGTSMVNLKIHDVFGRELVGGVDATMITASRPESFYFDFTKVTTVCDVGAGAGFPSIPIKICFPHLHVTIVDSLNKRITFLNHLSEQLGLQNVECYFLLRLENHIDHLYNTPQLWCYELTMCNLKAVRPYFLCFL